MAYRVKITKVSSGTGSATKFPALKNATLNKPLPIDVVLEESNTVANGATLEVFLLLLSLAAQGKVGTTITAFSASTMAVLLNANNEFNP